MINQILDLSKQLILIPSTKENSNQLKQVLELAKKKLLDFNCESFESNGIPSLLFYNTKTRPKKFKIILNGHLDVVPAKEEQFKPYEKDGKLFGRGATDMKAGAAVLILIFRKLAKQLNYPIALQLVTDEEIGGFNGVRYQISQGVTCDFFITGESTHLNIKNEAKGIVWAKLTVKGKSAHGAYPWLGENALWKVKIFLDNLQKKFPVPKKTQWKTTANLAKIDTTNSTFNRVPDNASVMIDFRYIPEDAKIIHQQIKSLVPKGIKLEFIENESFHYSNVNNIYSKTLSEIFKKSTGKPVKIVKGHGASDARFYSEKNIPGIEFGPSGHGLHSDDEWVDINSLSQYYIILESFLKRVK